MKKFMKDVCLFLISIGIGIGFAQYVFAAFSGKVSCDSFYIGCMLFGLILVFAGPAIKYVIDD